MDKWVLKNKKADFTRIMEEHKVSEVLARLLVNRNHESANDIDAFLHPNLNYLHNPNSLKDIEKACSILIHKIKAGKKIRIVGDYDVDGIISTYVLYTSLLKCNAVVDYEIPDRVKDGYGINIKIIEEAYDDEIDTILTCDNGISAFAQIERAKELGMTILITDHHDIPFQEDKETKKYLIPNADAVVNPKQLDCNYPWKNICGAVVAYKVVQVLYEKLHFNIENMEDLLEFIAIATVCDVMDLVDENRVIVKKGIELIKNTKNIGLKALLELNNVNLTSLSAYHLGFIIGPCLNASGRLDTAKKGLQLLLSESREEAVTLAGELKKLNDIRKELTIKGLEQAIKLIEDSDMKNQKVLVVYLEDCHESLAGIIAGRVKDRYNKPTIILTKSENGIKGSCRSIEQYNIYEELTKCKNLLTKYGGHPMAAGLSLEHENIDPLRAALNDNTSLTFEDLIPKISIDVTLPLGFIDEELIEELEFLEPFGKGNVKPVFAERNIRIRKAAVIGKNSNVLKLEVMNEYGKNMEALYFGEVEPFLECLTETYGKQEVDKIFQNRDNEILLSITYYPGINEYGGKRSLQIILQNYKIAVNVLSY